MAAWALAGVMACALFAAVVWLIARDRDRDRVDHAAGDVKQGFPKRFGAGVITTSGALGILIPPSIVMVIYCVATGGIVALDPPVIASRRPRLDRCSWPGSIPASGWPRCSGSRPFIARGRTTIRDCRARAGPSGSWRSVNACGDYCLILIVLGGIYAGLFTPTEAAAVSAVYAFVIAVFVYRDMSLKDVPRVLLGSANMSAMILYIITNACCSRS